MSNRIQFKPQRTYPPLNARRDWTKTAVPVLLQQQRPGVNPVQLRDELSTAHRDYRMLIVWLAILSALVILAALEFGLFPTYW